MSESWSKPHATRRRMCQIDTSVDTKSRSDQDNLTPEDQLALSSTEPSPDMPSDMITEIRHLP